MSPFIPKQKKYQSLWLTVSGGLFLLFGLFLLITNPGNKQYEEFATKELVKYLKENICQAKSAQLEEAIKSQMCNLMVDTGKKQVPRLVAETTNRYNYVLFSLYETNLLAYNFETIGVLNQFYVISVDQVYDSE